MMVRAGERIHSLVWLAAAWVMVLADPAGAVSPRWKQVAFDDEAKYYVNIDHIERQGATVVFWGKTVTASGKSTSVHYEMDCPDFEYREDRRFDIETNRQREFDYNRSTQKTLAGLPFLIKCFEIFCGEKRTSFHPNGNLRERGWVYKPEGGGMAVKTGPWTYWFDNGARNEEVTFKNGKKDGPWSVWDRDGKIWKEYIYKNDSRDGMSREWFADGRLSLEMNFEDGRPKGKMTRWDRQGRVIEEKIYTGSEEVKESADPSGPRP